VPSSKISVALPRFTVVSLLVVITGLALLLGPIASLGMGYAWHVLLLCLMLALTLIANAVNRPIWAMISCGLFALLGMLTLSGTILLTALATLLVIWGTAGFDNRKGRGGLIYVTVLVGVWGPYAETARQLRNLDKLREDYPFASISHRLPQQPREMQPAPSSLTPQVERDLAVFERFRESSSGRVRDLERLHSESYQRFVSSPGFGFSRMRPMTAWRLELDEIDTRQLPIPMDHRYGNEPEDLRTWALQSLFEPDATGVVRSRDEVAGFGSHAFRRGDDPIKKLDSNPAWQLDRLELVGLLTNESPVVYVSDQLPRMDILNQYETRLLDDFETSALARIRTARDIEIAELPDGVRMLGAIRAGKDCLVCHDTTRGTLLGAFSYRLTRVEAKGVVASPAIVDQTQ